VCKKTATNHPLCPTAVLVGADYRDVACECGVMCFIVVLPLLFALLDAQVLVMLKYSSFVICCTAPSWLAFKDGSCF
jgi:hypothetical protein